MTFRLLASRDQHHDPVAAAVVSAIHANLTITDVPNGVDEMQVSVRAGADTIGVELGHRVDADLAITVDYDTAAAILAEPWTAVRALLRGDIKVSVSATKHTAPPDAEAPAPATSHDRLYATHLRAVPA